MSNGILTHSLQKHFLLNSNMLLVGLYIFIPWSTKMELCERTYIV